MFRLEVKGTPAYSHEYMVGNATQNSHHPQVELTKPHGRKLAIVGGGPLVLQDLPELKAWEGDVWGINHTAQWLNENGVKATLFTVDPEGFKCAAPDAVLASVCDPVLVQSFVGRVRLFDMAQTHPHTGLAGGAFSSTCAAAVALKLGYIDVSYFGCEGSFQGADHVDRDEGRSHQIIVRAGGADYVTIPAFLIQCDELLKLFFFDNVYHNRSGGLLKAMQEHPDTWDVVGVSEEFRDHLIAVNGSTPFNEPYRPL